MTAAMSADQAPLPLTIVVPVKNEARNLAACLAALPVVAEVLVVDSASTDATRDIARAAGATVVDFAWNGVFPKKRNWVLQTHAFKTPWVLFLDADERLTPAFNAALPGALARQKVAGYWLNYDNYFMGRRLRHGVAQRKLALFRVGAGAYERIEDENWSALDMEVHEHPQLQGRVEEIAAPIEHNDFRDLHHYLARHNEYSTWEARRYTALMQTPEVLKTLTPRQQAKYRNLDKWWFCLAYFATAYILKRGFLDGGAGLAHAFLKASYFVEMRLKILELRAAGAAAARKG
jgi:glycosyltransferase involved in cell wall biosynthesis